MSINAAPAYGDGIQIPAGTIRPTAQPQTPYGPDHMWVATAVFLLSPAVIDRTAQEWMNGAEQTGLDLDHENLMTVVGPQCMKCQKRLDQTTYARPCPVRYVPIIGLHIPR